MRSLPGKRSISMQSSDTDSVEETHLSSPLARAEGTQ
jgi:hypothetical protein